ncbi:hypothetical protein FKV24_015245 [Lysobacter maris]|uniref:Uncharacterized protein n=1 Tax=Marilutibacter maris TaxID=1605891 RepID=A0A508A579_9GAMM|nr:hypothetical protein [Lysobacter maris]KAB8172195.1 hypothetical protein FKV24_015245 [Lysobacter maris]
MKCLVFLTAGALLACVQSAYAAIGIAPYVDCAEPEVIKVLAKNVSSVSITVEESSLPWSYSSRALVFVGYEISSGKATKLRQHRPVADYFGEVELESGGVIIGEISLSHLFVDYDEAHSSGDLIIFYEVDDSYSDKGAYIGGQGLLFIPKKKVFSSSCPSIIRSAGVAGRKQ